MSSCCSSANGACRRLYRRRIIVPNIQCASSKLKYDPTKKLRCFHTHKNCRSSAPSLEKEREEPIGKNPPSGKRVRYKAARQIGGLEENSDWEVTVGLEIHAQLNSKRKLFSSARTSFNATPNTRVALFDAAIPGSQPIFSKSVILPALRAAVALNCSINAKSSFDRKHYFYKDQPCGFQMTQFYEPFAGEGYLNLTELDGVTTHTGDAIKVGIQQVQLEQDTGKSLFQPSTSPEFPARTLVDLNRASSPLIEIITTPSIHSSTHASLVLRKIQAILKASSAAIEGMDRGGIRCDVNVSIRRRGDPKLGKRVEIKNVNSIKAVKDSIDSEVQRQISELEAGREIEGETRSWDIISATSQKLRGKEAVVDYRYMPDAEVPPLIISKSLVDHVKSTMAQLPDQLLSELLEEPYELTLKDARTLMELDDGARLTYYKEVLSFLNVITSDGEPQKRHLGRLVGNWVLHELGGRLSTRMIPWEENVLTPTHMSDILKGLLGGHLTSQNAKVVLDTILDSPQDGVPTVSEVIASKGLEVETVPNQEHELQRIAKELVAENSDKAALIRSGKKPGLVNFFIGAMMKSTKGKIGVESCKQAVEKVLADKSETNPSE